MNNLRLIKQEQRTLMGYASTTSEIVVGYLGTSSHDNHKQTREVTEEAMQVIRDVKQFPC